jgi:hypothetical protein
MSHLLRGLLLLAGLLLARPIVRWATSSVPHRTAPRGSRVDPVAVSAGHETRDLPLMPVVIGGVSIAVVIGIAVVAATWMQAARVDQPLSLSPPPGLATPVPPSAPPEPRLEEEPGAQLRAVRAAEDSVLTTAAWVDRPNGVARIPIDRAIDLLAANPPPARSAEEASQYPDAAPAPPSNASSGRVPAGRAP